MRPAALHGDRGKGGRQCCQQPAAAIDADHLESLAGQPAADQVTEEVLPFGGALAPRQAEIDDLLLAVPTQAKSDQDGPSDRAVGLQPTGLTRGAGFARQDDAIEH